MVSLSGYLICYHFGKRSIIILILHSSQWDQIGLSLRGQPNQYLHTVKNQVEHNLDLLFHAVLLVFVLFCKFKAISHVGYQPLFLFFTILSI